jgi:TolB protein
MKWLIAVLACVAIGAGCGGGGEPRGLIAFTSDRDGDWEIFEMNADGTEVRQLTDNDYTDIEPAWAPYKNRQAGSRIAFTSDRDGDGDGEIFSWFIEHPEFSSRFWRVTDNDDSDSSAAWSPDGDRIAFESDREIFVIYAGGSEVRQLTDNDAWDGYPAWSPDGKRIAFTSGRDGDLELFEMNADGSEVRQLTDNDADDACGVWSPDGKHIAFTSDRDGDFEIFVMKADGTQVRQLTNNDDFDACGVWSPDGKHIAFNSGRFGDEEIFVMKADGTDVHSTGQKGSSPSWTWWRTNN